MPKINWSQKAPVCFTKPGNVAFTSHPAGGPLQGNPLAKDLLACMYLHSHDMSSGAEPVECF